MSADSKVADIKNFRRRSERAAQRVKEELGDPRTYLSFPQYAEVSGAGSPDLSVRIGWPAVRTTASRLDAWLELSLAVSGLALVGFMAMHMGLLVSSLLGAGVMDRLASFLERYYLLHSAAPLLILLLIAHVAMALRKAPSGARAQMALLRHMRTLRHFDTWMWAVQLATGAAIVFLASIHLWVVLTDLPIQAAKSGTRIYDVYLWFYVPFILLVEAHASAGLYRIAVKWSSVNRIWAHAVLAVWMVIFLALGFAVLAALYGIGAQS
jgi:fumarate reductase subunit C